MIGDDGQLTCRLQPADKVEVVPVSLGREVAPGDTFQTLGKGIGVDLPHQIPRHFHRALVTFGRSEMQMAPDRVQWAFGGPSSRLSAVIAMKQQISTEWQHGF